jgi:hypothetical protein
MLKIILIRKLPFQIWLIGALEGATFHKGFTDYIEKHLSVYFEKENM